jgi:hypothetical protein
MARRSTPPRKPAPEASAGVGCSIPKNLGGRPTDYLPEYCDDIVNWFLDESVVPLPLFADYAIKLGVSRETLHEWRRVHPEFSDAYKKAKAIQKARWIKGSLQGKFNPAFTIFFGKNVFKWTDKQEINATVTVEDLFIKLAEKRNGSQ